MKTHLTISALLLTGVAYAQLPRAAGDSEAYWRTNITPTPTERQAIVSTLGTGNAGTGGGTAAVINQSGAGNRFSFDGASGNTGNQITFTQNGNNNQLDFQLAGSNNTYTLGQTGNNNRLDLQNFQTNGARLEVQQTGNNNRLDSNGYPFADASIPLKITQSGGMRLIITSGPQ